MILFVATLALGILFFIGIPAALAGYLASVLLAALPAKKEKRK